MSKKRVKSHEVEDTLTFENSKIKRTKLFVKITPKWIFALFALSIAILITATVLLIHYYL